LCTLTRTTQAFNPVLAAIDTFGNAVYPAAVEEIRKLEANSPLVGDVTYLVDSYTFEPTYLGFT
jgi:hypothetical protein